jgi:CDP-diacylglycerol--glycerol-3-phosphate 3-phosphatidyltransferase
MKLLPEWLKNGYLKVIDPVAEWLVKRGVHPNTITVFGTLCTVAGGVIYATGHIKTGGWFLGATALFDVLDGTVARRSNKSSTFGAFLDSTLDRVADGALHDGDPRGDRQEGNDATEDPAIERQAEERLGSRQ